MLHNPASNENTLGLIVVQIERVYTSILLCVQYLFKKCCEFNILYTTWSKGYNCKISCIRHGQRGIIVKYPVYDMVKGV